MTFDRRGHGRSDDPCRGYDFDTLADDIGALLDGIDLQNVVLVGHSLGGAEVVRYLTRHRATCRSCCSDCAHDAVHNEDRR